MSWLTKELKESGEKTTLYEIIGCPPTATQEELKKAYYKKARELHPDHNKDDILATQKFQQLNEAYEILRDPEKRRRYDQMKDSPATEGSELQDVEMYDIISQIMGFGQRRSPKGPKVSPSYRLLSTPLEASYTGGQITANITIYVVCPGCLGTGTTNGEEYPECSHCHGSGSEDPRSPSFLFPCHKCGGCGSEIPEEIRCPNCKGKKLVKEKKSFTVDIPIAAEASDTIVLPNQGDEYPGKEKADLILIIYFRAHPFFIKDGDDLIYKKRLTTVEVMQGTAFLIQTLDGRNLDVYTPIGKEIDKRVIKWIPGEGFPVKGNPTQKGNLYIVFSHGLISVLYGPFFELGLSVSSFISRFFSKIELQDAPEDKQEQLRDYLFDK